MVLREFVRERRQRFVLDEDCGQPKRWRTDEILNA